MHKVIFDEKGDALYIVFGTEKTASTKCIDENRYVDYDSNGTPAAVEFINVSDGVELGDLPHRSTLEQVVAGLGIKVMA